MKNPHPLLTRNPIFHSPPVGINTPPPTMDVQALDIGFLKMTRLNTCWACNGKGVDTYVIVNFTKTSYGEKTVQKCQECDGTGLRGMNPKQITWWRDQSECLSLIWHDFFESHRLPDQEKWNDVKEALELACDKLGISIDIIKKLNDSSNIIGNRMEIELIAYRNALFAIAHKMASSKAGTKLSKMKTKKATG